MYDLYCSLRIFCSTLLGRNTNTRMNESCTKEIKLRYELPIRIFLTKRLSLLLLALVFLVLRSILHPVSTVGIAQTVLSLL